MSHYERLRAAAAAWRDATRALSAARDAFHAARRSRIPPDDLRALEAATVAAAGHASRALDALLAAALGLP